MKEDINDIETSEDAEDVGKGGLYPYDPAQADIDIREIHFSIYDLLRRYNDGRLIINSVCQRKFVWKLEQKSKFIETVILNFPLPYFYVSETREGKHIVIDGLQRVMTLYEFVNDKFKLEGLEALRHLNGKSFTDLKAMPGAYQTKIEDKKTTFYVLKPSVPIEVVYDLLIRIHSGDTKFERQELRNNILIGKATNLLNELSLSDCFKKAIDNGISSDRMKDQEAILRYLAFRIFDYKRDYQGDMSAFVEQAMRSINKMSDEDIFLLKTDFERVMQLSYALFGDRNFRVPFPDKSNRGRINIAVLESVTYFFSIQTDAFLYQYKAVIVKNLDSLLQNPEYLDAVQKSTGDKKQVNSRFTLAQQILGNVAHADTN